MTDNELKEEREKAAKRWLEKDNQRIAAKTALEQWIDDKKTGGIGGKNLDGPTFHNPNPKEKDPGPVEDSLGRLTGKKI